MRTWESINGVWSSAFTYILIQTTGRLCYLKGVVDQLTLAKYSDTVSYRYGYS